MQFHKSYIENGKILFDLWLVEAYPEMNTEILTIQSNIPNALMYKEYPQLDEDLDSLDILNEKTISDLIARLCKIITQSKDAKYFYWPDYSISREYNDENFFDCLRTFDLDEDLKPDTLYSQNCNCDIFYMLSREFSYHRIFSETSFSSSVQLIQRSEFEKFLPVDFGDDYLRFFNLNNLFYRSIEKDYLQFIMTSNDYYPLLFFMIHENQQLTRV